MRHRAATFLVFGSLTLLCCGGSAPAGKDRGMSQGPGDRPRTEGDSISVLVADSASHDAVAGARVFILSEDGKELAATSTDEWGKAALPVLNPDLRPKYVLVQHPHYFLSGLTWLDGMREYYILTTILTVR